MRVLDPVLVALALAVGCVENPAPHPPSVNTIQTSGFGSWIVIEMKNHVEVSGELIAVGPELVSIRPEGSVNIHLPKAEIAAATLYRYDSDAGIGAWAALGSLSTISHGFWLVFSFPTWVLSGAIASAIEHAHVRMKYPDHDWSELAKWARFPQGLPVPRYVPPPTSPPADAAQVDVAPPSTTTTVPVVNDAESLSK